MLLEIILDIIQSKKQKSRFIITVEKSLWWRYIWALFQGSKCETMLKYPSQWFFFVTANSGNNLSVSGVQNIEDQSPLVEKRIFIFSNYSKLNRMVLWYSFLESLSTPFFPSSSFLGKLCNCTGWFKNEITFSCLYGI